MCGHIILRKIDKNEEKLCYWEIIGILYHKINNKRYLSRDNTRRTPHSAKALMRDEFSQLTIQ